MQTKITTIALFAVLFAYAVADGDRRQKDSDGYSETRGNFADKSSEGDVSVEDESGGCDRSIDDRISPEVLEREDQYGKGRHKVGYSSARASAAASADASASAYEHNPSDRIFI
ncbi:unnamed protein product, partial [Iphiclides podalirius]